MKWVTATDLEQWAATLIARADLSSLVGDLIRASAEEITHYRFPAGDQSQHRGFDGVLEAKERPPYIPGGRSIWEFSVQKETIRKLNSDFTTRTSEEDAEVRRNTTYVGVSPHSWNYRTKIDDWIRKKNSERGWKEVKYLDGVQLAEWLQLHPAVAARFARTYLPGYRDLGAESTDDFWEFYARQFKPPLTEEVLLCDRHDDAERLIHQLMGGAGINELLADSPDEALAFAVAAIRKAPPAKRGFIEARTLIVETEEAARTLSSRKNLVFITRNQAVLRNHTLSTFCPVVSGFGRETPRRSMIKLGRQSHRAFTEALITMGFDQETAHHLARECARSVTILSRRRPGGTPQNPVWMSQRTTLLPALVIGGWDDLSLVDKAALETLANKPYDEIERALRPLLEVDDPPLDHEENIWKIRAPVDAFMHLARFLTAADLDRLRNIATIVFSKLDEKKKDDDRFGFSVDQTTKYSEWLKDGLATTLLQISVLSEQADLVIPRSSGETFVNDLVAALPGLSANYRLLASLRRQLPMLAEAAPGPLLAALENLLEDGGTQLLPIFEVSDELFHSSDHTGVLFALETIAWDPKWFHRSAVVLARLAELDPGGKLSNRPINSLRDLFVPWLPQTNAKLVQRLATLDHLLKRHAFVGAQILESMLPKEGGVMSSSARPRYRDAGASEAERMTYGLVWKTYKEVGQRALALAANDTSWITKLLRHYRSFDEELQAGIRIAAEEGCKSSDAATRTEVIKSLRNVIEHNRQYSDAAWALSDEMLDPLSDILERYSPSDIRSEVIRLFDDWTPYLPNTKSIELEKIAAARIDAVKQLLSERGLEELGCVAAEVKLDSTYGATVATILPDRTSAEALLIMSLSHGMKLQGYRNTLSAVAYQRYGDEWLETIKSVSSNASLSSDGTAELFFNWPDGSLTWGSVASLGLEIENSYWLHRPSWALRALSSAEVEFAVDKYVVAGRASAAVQAATFAKAQIETSTLFRILDALIPEINQSSDRTSQMLPYNVSELFEELSGRDDAPAIEVARREYGYFPMLEHQRRKITLHEILLQNPALYVQLICDIYRDSSDDPKEPTSEQRSRATIAYRILSSLGGMPGLLDERIDPTVLRAWVSEVRRLSAEHGRQVPAEQSIGRLLAHSPVDPVDGGWPHIAARDLIEESCSKELEQGFTLEKFNMRGVFSKSPGEGGQQERDFAARERAFAAVCAGWPRTAAMLEAMAQRWEAAARTEDISARHDEMR
jgi:hypothetical protein